MGPLIPLFWNFWWHLPWVSKPGWIPCVLFHLWSKDSPLVRHLLTVNSVLISTTIDTTMKNFKNSRLDRKVYQNKTRYLNYSTTYICFPWSGKDTQANIMLIYIFIHQYISSTKAFIYQKVNTLCKVHFTHAFHAEKQQIQCRRALILKRLKTNEKQGSRWTILHVFNS